mmetsp:Transcript_21464/g.50020  ORF Transcript_21464/g.50020 Transcript_21464/m.50020 type:complete len:214 (+) Transcript_21464:552-1193(+)
MVARHGHVHVGALPQWSKSCRVEVNGLVAHFPAAADFLNHHLAAVLVVFFGFADGACCHIQHKRERAEDEADCRPVRQRANMVSGKCHVSVAQQPHPGQVLFTGGCVVPRLRHVGVDEGRHGDRKLVDPNGADDETGEDEQSLALVVEIKAVFAFNPVEGGDEEHHAHAEVHQQKDLPRHGDEWLHGDARRVLNALTNGLHRLECHVQVLPLV